MPSKTQRMWACSRSVMTTLAVVTSEHPLKLVGGPGVEDLLDPVRRGKELRRDRACDAKRSRARHRGKEASREDGVGGLGLGSP
jgi:hypothetical protein